jgi:hypothetical protein
MPPLRLSVPLLAVLALVGTAARAEDLPPTDAPAYSAVY